MRHYRCTPLEQWVEQMYRGIEITEPWQLNVSEIASKLNIWVYYLNLNSQSVHKNGMYSINIDRRLSPQEQWEDFLHELCHVLRHAGNQLHLPEPFTELQEAEAQQFQLYASIPYFMLQRMELPQQNNEIIDVLAQEFGVTHRLAQLRLEQIQRRILQGIMDEEATRGVEKEKEIRSPDPASAAGSETSLHFPAHPDSTDSKSRQTRWSDETKRLMDKLYRQVERKE